MSLEHHSVAREHGPSGGPQGFARDTIDDALLFDERGEGIVVTAGVRIEQFRVGDTTTPPLRVFADQDASIRQIGPRS